MTARLMFRLGLEVFNRATAHLHRVDSKVTLQELLHTLVTMHAGKSDDEWAATVEWLANDSEESRAGWMLVQAAAELDRTARMAAMQGLDVQFEFDRNDLKAGKVHATFTDAGRQVREQLRRESDDGEVTA